jgi:CHASE2 domain-containing protein
MFSSLVALLALQRGAEAFTPVEELERLGYDALQYGLRLPLLRADAPRFVVVDISGLPPTGGVTSRRRLESLIRTLADVHPKAVGVDVDFSAEDNREFVTADDPSFFDTCLNVGVPVFLGVLRRAGRGHDEWLGRPEYAKLAASIVIPRDAADVAAHGVPGPYPLFVPRLDVQTAREAGHRDDLQSMANALATASGRVSLLPGDAPPSRIMRHVGRRRLDDSHDIDEFAIDYHFVGTLQRIAPKWETPLELLNAEDKRKVDGSLVLLGDVDKASDEDRFVRPGTTGTVPGVLVHAAATMTLLQPLYVFTPEMRAFADVACLAAALTILNRRAKRKTRHHRSLSVTRRFVWNERLVTTFAFVVVAMVIAFAVLIARIVWFDWITAIVFAGLHATFDKGTEEIAEAAV